MTREASQPTLRGGLILIGALAAGAALAAVLYHSFSGGDDSEARPEHVDVAAAGSNETEPVVRARRKRPPDNTLELPTLTNEERRVLAPDFHGIKEIQQADFEINGGIDSPGTDPEAARREVNAPDWAPQMERELGDGLRQHVLAEGTEIDRLECQRGRCLVELTFRGMLDGLGRVDAIRAWLTEHVRCRAYTEGPDEGETPSTIPSQQIWILCGEPNEQAR